MMNRKMMMDRAGRAMGGRGMNADRMGRAMANAADRMGSGMRIQPPTPINRPIKDEVAYKKGGSVKESKAMMKKEVAFMKKKGAPKSMIKHEMKEAGVKKMRTGGSASSRADGVASKGKTKGKMIKMAYGGKC